MWQFLWGIFTVIVGTLIVLKPGSQPAADWQKLPTLTPTPGELSVEWSRRLPTLTPTPQRVEAEQRQSRLPTLTPTSFPVGDRGEHVVAQWPIEVSSAPLQPLIPAVPPAQLPADLPITLPEQGSTPVVPPAVPAAESAVYTAPGLTSNQEPDSVRASVNPLTGLPVQGRISQDFGCSPYYTGIAGPGCPGDRPWFHDALDIAAAADTPVTAMISGTVLFAGEDTKGPKCKDNGGKEERGYGLAVVVDNGVGWRVLYAHLSKVKVGPGQVITPETVVGTVGATGCVTGAHLHFGLQYNGTLMDPRLMINPVGIAEATAALP